MKMSESIALDKSFQSKFTKKVKKVKERVKASGGVIQKTEVKTSKPQHGLIYVGHIPHGFYENEMMGYFKQFGKISNLRICRSRATGRSKGYGFVEFADEEVAKIAAETMDNYVMFNRRLIAKLVSRDKLLQGRYKGPSWTERSYPLKAIREKANKLKNKNIDHETHLKKSKQLISQVNKNLRKLQELGIHYQFKAVDDEDNLNEMIIKASATLDNEHNKEGSGIEVNKKKKVDKEKKKMLKKKSR